MKPVKRWKMELHTHTRYSHDSLLSLQLLHLVCRVKNIKCIAITDHNEIEGALEFKRRYPSINVIVGEEIMTSQGEIIGLFLKERIPAALTAKETIQAIKKQGGLVYIPHPQDKKRYKTILSRIALQENLADIDVIEAYNGRTVSVEDLKAQQFIATQKNTLFVVGSDAHTFFELGRNYIETNIFAIDNESFMESVRNGSPQISPCLSVAHWVTKFARILKLLIRGDFKEILRKLKII